MLSFSDVCVSLNNVEILHNVSHLVPTGEIHAITGPSGSGKTTLLRAIAGLIHDMQGSVVVNGIDVSRKPSHRRGIGFVFQEPYLFESITVAENIAYGLKIAGVSRRDRHEAVNEMLELIDLPDLADRHTSTLSGGQARRVSLARHLITKPSVLLMDEPFTALDSETQSALSQRVHTFLTTHNITVLVSTHLGFDVEAFADTIIDLASICEQR